MSSAILYVAIVAIWACVLIPRWLRRYPAHGAAADEGNAPAVPGGVVRGDVVSGSDEDSDEDLADGDVPAADIPAGTVLASYTETDYTEIRYAENDYAETDYAEAAYTETAYAETAYAETIRADAGTSRWKRRHRAAPREVPEADSRGEAPPPAPAESRRRMLAARRRLLGMLILLEAAAVALAVYGLAASWVLIPPSVMFIGYLLLLREASHADAERTQREREHEQEAARARARAQARARERAARRIPVAAPAAPAARYEEPSPGRDFAPGLAGKYTTSNAEVADIYEQADEDSRDEYPVKKLRAVGD